MLMRKLMAALCPLLMCLLTCVVFRWLDSVMAAGSFLLFLLKGLLLGACIALLLPVGGIATRSGGLTPMLYVAAGLLAALLLYQYLETVGAVHWAALKAILSINGQVVLVESAAAGFLAVTATLNRRR